MSFLFTSYVPAFLTLMGNDTGAQLRAEADDAQTVQLLSAQCHCQCFSHGTGGSQGGQLAKLANISNSEHMRCLFLANCFPP